MHIMEANTRHSTENKQILNYRKKFTYLEPILKICKLCWVAEKCHLWPILYGGIIDLQE
jgi:hypothetical protein